MQGLEVDLLDELARRAGQDEGLLQAWATFFAEALPSPETHRRRYCIAIAFCSTDHLAPEGFNYTIVILDWSNLTDYDAALQEKKWETLGIGTLWLMFDLPCIFEECLWPFFAETFKEESDEFTKCVVQLRVDMVTYAYWYITPQRMVAGAYSPYGFLDSMLYATVVPPDSWLT